jgi:hypothetical protein
MELYAHPSLPRHLVLNTDRSPHMARIISESVFAAAAVYDPALRGFVMDTATWTALRGYVMRLLDVPPVVGGGGNPPPPPSPPVVTVVPRPPPPPVPPAPPPEVVHVVPPSRTVPAAPSFRCTMTQTETLPITTADRGTQTVRMAPENAEEEEEEERAEGTVKKQKLQAAVRRPVRVPVSEPSEPFHFSPTRPPPPSSEINVEDDVDAVSDFYNPPPPLHLPLESQLLGRRMVVLPPPTPTGAPTTVRPESVRLPFGGNDPSVDGDHESMLSGYHHFPDVLLRREELRKVLEGGE